MAQVGVGWGAVLRRRSIVEAGKRLWRRSRLKRSARCSSSLLTSRNAGVALESPLLRARSSLVTAGLLGEVTTRSACSRDLLQPKLASRLLSVFERVRWICS